MSDTEQGFWLGLLLGIGVAFVVVMLTLALAPRHVARPTVVVDYGNRLVNVDGTASLDVVLPADHPNPFVWCASHGGTFHPPALCKGVDY